MTVNPQKEGFKLPNERPEPQLESLKAVPAEGLLFTTDRDPGIRRTRRGRGFLYWICVSPRGHLQARALPRIRRRVSQDLRKTGLPREKVLATIVKLLDATLVRVGNEEYARENHSFGLTRPRSAASVISIPRCCSHIPRGGRRKLLVRRWRGP